jgi:SAM-dependent methyltransferase
MARQASPLAVPRHLERGNYPTPEEWRESGLFAVDLLSRTLGREDLSGVKLLDVGCGTKVVKTLLDHSMPIGRYVGVDAAPEVIGWLRANVSDPRFEFHHLDALHPLYNPQGKDLASFELLPTGRQRFDLICLISVFTHLAPHDYVAMLRLLRRHARPHATLLFSLIIVDDPEHPSPFVQGVAQGLASDDPMVRAQTETALAKARAHRRTQEGSRFIDAIPGSPLMLAQYEKDYALELVDGTGWKVASLHPRERFIEHFMVCHPV